MIRVTARRSAGHGRPPQPPVGIRLDTRNAGGRASKFLNRGLFARRMRAVAPSIRRCLHQAARAAPPSILASRSFAASGDQAASGSSVQCQRPEASLTIATPQRRQKLLHPPRAGSKYARLFERR
jgi:hypothetical protein